MEFAKDIFLEELLTCNVCDVADIDYIKNSSFVKNLIPIRKLFCDNIILWCIYTPDVSVPEIMSIIRNYFRELKIVNLRTIGKNKQKDYSVISKDEYRKYYKMHNIQNQDDMYISIKVSLSDKRIDDVVPTIKERLKILKQHFIYIHDIDVTVDCAGTIKKLEIYEHIIKTGVDAKSVVNNTKKVGNNCISWTSKTDTGIKMRTKVYNKFVQMLESSGTYRNIGSVISEFVVNPSAEFRQALIDANKYGLTRVEITVYTDEIFLCEEYENLMDETIGLLSGCKIYITPFEEQWKALVENITNVVTMYDAENEKFQYCHWYNSITGKMQGCIKENVKQKNVYTLIANYSFNDRLVYYYEVKLNKDKSYFIVKEEVFMRENGCESITLVPGPQQGLYPSYEGVERQHLTFEDVSLINHNNIIINWPKNRINNRSKPLAKIKEYNTKSTKDETVLDDISSMPKSVYRSGYNILKEHTNYDIMGATEHMFRNNKYVYAKLKDEEGRSIYIRCGKCLGDLIKMELNKKIKFKIQTGKIFYVYDGGTGKDIEVTKVDN